jgi:hypothetical protein
MLGYHRQARILGANRADGQRNTNGIRANFTPSAPGGAPVVVTIPKQLYWLELHRSVR